MDPNTLAALRATHELYCQLTSQKLSLRFDRERLWYEFLRADFSTQDLKRVVAYLRKEIRASRRNVGALKLSNLLQLDRYWAQGQGRKMGLQGSTRRRGLVSPYRCERRSESSLRARENFRASLFGFGNIHPSGGYRSENLEKQTFPDEAFDLVVTQDVFEHIFDAPTAFLKNYRTLRSGGAHIFTTPLVNKGKPSERWASLSDAGIVYHHPST
jgi:SAM-dependent methyltransferase